MKPSNPRKGSGDEIKMNESVAATRRLQIRPKSELLVMEEFDSSDEEHDVKQKKPRYGVKLPKSYDPAYSSDSDSIPVVDENEFRNFVDVRAKRFSGSEGASLLWTQFVVFNQIFLRGSPFKADAECCRDFLAVLEVDCGMPRHKLAAYKRCLSIYVEGGSEMDFSTDGIEVGIELRNTSIACKYLLENVSRKYESLRSSRSTSTFEMAIKALRIGQIPEIAGHRNRLNSDVLEFIKFCTIRKIDPVFAIPSHVRSFLVNVFTSKIKPSNLSSSPKFFSDNVRGICQSIEQVLKFCQVSGLKLLQTREMMEVIEQAELMDTGEVGEGKLGELLAPEHWYSRYCGQQHSKEFWKHGLMRRMLADITSGHLTIEQVAWELGVSLTMVRCALARRGPDPEPSLTLADYMQRRFGDHQTFWGEASTLDLLEAVRNRKVTPEEAAWKIGVSKKLLLSKVGDIKTKENLFEEKIEKINEKRVQDEIMRQNAKSPLELQISAMEQSEEKLSAYETVRLNNMRERQAMLNSLQLKEEKIELKKLTPGNKKTMPVDYGTRKRSRRLQAMQGKRKSVENKNAIKQACRISPLWVGKGPRGLPFTKNTVNLLDICTDYYAGRRTLDGVRAEVEAGPGRTVVGEVAWQVEGRTEDWRASRAAVTSLDCWGELICAGDTEGRLAVCLAGHSLTLHPHTKQITRATFQQGGSGLSVITASLDGTVRRAELGAGLSRSLLEASLPGEIHWLELEGEHSSLLHLSGGALVRLDRRWSGQQVVCKLQSGQFGTNVSICPGRPHLLAAPAHQAVLLFDTRAAAKPLLRLGEGQDWAGATWSPAGRYLLGCPEQKGNRQLVWWDRQLLEFDDPLISPKPSGTFDLKSGQRFNFSRNFGATWSPWQEGVVITAATLIDYRDSVIAVDINNKSIVSEVSDLLINDGPGTNYCIASHPTRHQLTVANTIKPGILATLFYQPQDV